MCKQQRAQRTATLPREFSERLGLYQTANRSSNMSAPAVRTTVIASNRTPYTATLCWCSEGAETAYGQPLAPGEVRMQETFVGHCWRLHGEGGSVDEGPAAEGFMEAGS